MKFYNVVCTFFGIGKIKFAPGTFGSLAAFPIWILGFYPLLKYGLIVFLGFWILFIAFLFFLGLRCADIHAQKTKKQDASEIVIDEVVGQLISLFLSFCLAIILVKIFPTSGDIILIYFQHPLFYLLVNFIFFRLFDILKPSLVGYLDKNLKAGLGVMLDDVAAGVFSAATVMALPFLMSLF